MTKKLSEAESVDLPDELSREQLDALAGMNL